MTKLSAPFSMSLASLQNSNSSLSSPTKSHHGTPHSSPSHTLAPATQSLTTINKQEGPDTTLSQDITLYAVPDKHKTKVKIVRMYI